MKSPRQKIMDDFFKKIFNISKGKKLVFFAVSDIILIALSVWLAFILRFEGQIPAQYSAIIERVIFLLILFILPVFYFSGLYSFSWSYVSINELLSLIKAATISFIFLAVAVYFSKDFPSFLGFPRSTFFISYFLVVIFCGALRFGKRAFFEIFKKRGEKQRRVLIVGAGDAGEQIARGVLAQKNYYFPVGFVDDNKAKQGIAIHGIRVLGEIKDIPKLVGKNNVEEIIIALPSAGSSAIKRAVELGRVAKIKNIKIAPSLAEIIDGKISLRDLRNVQPEDLLGREPISLSRDLIENFIKNKVVLITGAAGSIGSELSRQTAKFKPSLLLILDREETGIFNISQELNDNFPDLSIKYFVVDIRDKNKIERILEKFSPDIIFHAAAYKHVPLMEENPDEAVKNNIFGTKIIAEAALKYGVDSFILISTDKAVNPVSIMGATKRAGEMICQALNQKGGTKFISVRFGNVLDSRGSVIPIFREQIKKGGPVEVTHNDMQRYFMLISEAVLLVMEAGAMGEGGEVFVLDMGKPIKILDLAREMIKFSGLEPDKDIPIIFTEPRPGEKFFEEFLTAEEGTIATQNQKIFMAKLSSVKRKKLEGKLGQLKSAAESGDKNKIIEILKDIVPTFKPASLSY